MCKSLLLTPLHRDRTDNIWDSPVAGFTTRFPPSSSATAPTVPSSSEPFTSSSSARPVGDQERTTTPATISAGIIAGISVGVFFFLLLVGSLIIGLCWYRRKARRAEGSAILLPTLSTDTFPMVHEQHIDHITPFASTPSRPGANRRTGGTTSSFGNMGPLSPASQFAKSSRPTLPLGAHEVPRQELNSPQFDQSASPRDPIGSGKESANRRHLVALAYEGEDGLTSSGSPTSGLSYVRPHDRECTTRPPSYRSEHP